MAESYEDQAKRYREDYFFHYDKRCSCTNEGRCKISQADAKRQLLAISRKMVNEKEKLRYGK